MLVVNQPGENNNVDQSLLTLRLFSQFGISSIYRTHQQLQRSLTVHEGALCVDGREVAVVYFRSGYTPADYPSAAEWAVREQIECSRAVKVGVSSRYDIVSERGAAPGRLQEGPAAAVDVGSGGAAAGRRREGCRAAAVLRAHVSCGRGGARGAEGGEGGGAEGSAAVRTEAAAGGRRVQHLERGDRRDAAARRHVGVTREGEA